MTTPNVINSITIGDTEYPLDIFPPSLRVLTSAYENTFKENKELKERSLVLDYALLALGDTIGQKAREHIATLTPPSTTEEAGESK